ncbi:uncharacterized protein LOC119400691 [Rhipicephalus sanguineus]|uniref:uncharacterized protein LOC119400691 n=1 Tax=Rhipicephalus sanguineus TaxID=34632 RepID=UPI001894698D|nr:uncharacterized protein LOC119400691 [Rhipicephalus sanguineus]
MRHQYSLSMGKYTFTLALFVLSIENLALAKLGAPGGLRKLHYDVPDAFEVMSRYKYAVAISDFDNDTIFDCLAANRTDIDYEAKTATYVWMFKGQEPRDEVSFLTMPGPTPGTLDLMVGDDPSVKEAILYYTDDNCSVMDIEYDGHRCILWLKPYLKDAVPQACIDHFVDTCGVVVFPNRSDLCDDGDGDY